MVFKSACIAILAAILSLAIVVSNSIGANLIARWSLDETSGDTAKDIIGNNHGAFKGGKPVWSAGKFGNGLEFKAPSQYVEVPKNPKLELQSLTLVAWVNFKLLGTRQEVVSYSDNYAIMYEGTTFHAFIHQGGKWPMAHATTAVKVNTWYQVALAFEGGTVKIYVDGKSEGKASPGGKIDYQNFQLWFGGGPADNAFWLTGMLDEIEIWDKAMTDDEVQKNFTSPPIAASVEPNGKLATVWGTIKK